MGIIRAPLASKSFTQVPNHWLRDKHLSAKAKGILAYICSHAPGYDLTVKQMVAEMKDGQDAIYAGMKELEAAGYLRRDRRRAERGQLGGVDYTIVENPSEEDPTCSGFSRSGAARSGDAQSGSARSGGSVTKNNIPKNTKGKNTNSQNTTRSDQNSTASGRFAPSSGGDTNSIFNDDPWALTFDDPPPPKTSPAAELTRKREDDRQMFRDLIEATHLRSDGTLFREGEWPVDAFYNGFRKLKGKKRIDFPGAYIQPMYATNPASGVRDWLLSNGLEPL